MKNAHQVGTGVYERLGINLKTLGCLMIDCASPVKSFSRKHEYVSKDPQKFWIQGALSNWHVTARYGFLEGVNKDDIDAVLEGLTLPSRLTVGALEVFASPYKDEEPYECLVVRVEDEKLKAINTALSVLPNVNTFAQYKAHITIGYFKKGHVPSVDLVKLVEVIGLDYGAMA